MAADLDVLAQNRDALLLAEMAAWLHMFGKYHEDFLNGIYDMDLKIPTDIPNNFHELNQILINTWIGNIWKVLPIIGEDAEKLSIDSFIKFHRDKGMEKTYPKLIQLIIDAHGRGSGTDKGILRENSYKEQLNGNIFLASAFGHEPSKIDLTEIETNRKKFYQFLEERLVYLQKEMIRNQQDKKQWSVENWENYRGTFIERLEKEFKASVADTRQPINDILLWDQTLATVAFLKTELAAIILDKQWVSKFEEELRYRLLTISLNGTEFMAQSLRLGELLPKRILIQQGFDKIKLLLEVEFPMGYEIYRDMDHIIFLVPELRKIKKDFLDLTVNDSETLRKTIEDRFKKAVLDEIEIKIDLNSNGSRNVFCIATELEKSVESFSPTYDLLKTSWQGQREADKCRICQIRPQGYGIDLIDEYKENADYYRKKAQKHKACGICMQRLKDRCQKWLNKLDTTIWLDEIADNNGRVALIVAKFNLTDWQNGKMVSTFRNVNDIANISFASLANALNVSDNVNLNSIREYSQIAKTHAKTIGNLTKLLIETEDLNESGYSAVPMNEKRALAVWRKTPSFARLRRIWETCKTFWDEVDAGFEKTVGDVKKRLKIKTRFKPGRVQELAPYYAYIAWDEKNKVQFSIISGDKESESFYITENLTWLAKKMGAGDDAQSAVEFIQTKLSREINIYDSEGETRDQPLGTLEIIGFVQDDTSYLPAITLLSDPGRFMALVPANKALKVAQAVKGKYIEEMRKVRNRLPVALGLVYAPSHTPLVTLLDAGRRMLDMPLDEKTWEIGVGKEDGDDYLLQFKENGIEWRVPKKMGDKETLDIWYPYFYIHTHETSAPTDRAFKGAKGWLVHVSELRPNDSVRLQPSYFDFEFLDSSARRFEISYTDKGRRRSVGNATKPYFLENLDQFQSLWELLGRLSQSQIMNINCLIETKRAEWRIGEAKNGDKDEVFREFVRAVFHNASWKMEVSIEDKDKLIDAAYSGMLNDVITLYHQIMKEKPGETLKEVAQ